MPPSPTASPAALRATHTPEPEPTEYPTISPTPAPPFNTLLFTGNIVPARCVQAKIDELGNPDYPYEEVKELISQVDLAVGTLNGTLSDFPTLTGCTDTFLLVGRAENAGALARAGFDAMSVATNHIKNCGMPACGDRAFLDTLDNLQLAGVRPIGAGLNLEESLQPQVFELRGVRFAFVSLGEIESTTFAGEDSPGIAVLEEDNLREAIAAARQAGDVVIVLPHWGPEYSVQPNHNQTRYARVAVEAGADLVVGNHTHTVQTLETIDGVPVFYGLGNFMFDQDWSRETSQGVALRVTFQGATYAGFDLVPVHIDGDGRVHIAEAAEAIEILNVMMPP
jgi:poly-gamma-glutamate synthesis protein (capsule biosynthesis protein)